MNTSKWILLAGVIMVALSAFGVNLWDKADLFKFGVGFCFASRLVG